MGRHIMKTTGEHVAIGSDFNDNVTYRQCTSGTVPARTHTWGSIKTLYR